MTATPDRRRKGLVLTAKRARELLAYDPESSVLTWRVRRQGVRGVGSPAGAQRDDGYVTFMHQHVGTRCS
ncbi:hypothetical protein DC522_32540 [Microvirga sp. KLBC 81]|uniref:hypothetical protein n=1 Tax=Microvirga sp. KLBC 81 TaxID=1862707 RepID=UPI000D51CF05|nr:hypothetical protein [Microvirga sp. KLBC 81]PVE20405.1 hypothetical protein DC522_32540 [Microvirga sp. KLBC 81]